MKVLLIKDVYKLGRAGDVKKVATGYGRNYLLPQSLAVLATPGALKQADRIREQAETRRAIENVELSGLADQLSELRLIFPAKAGETGKLYGSVTPQMIADAIKEQIEIDIDRRQIDTQPIRTIGLHKANVRLTIDLIPELEVLVHLEGESPESALIPLEGEQVEGEVDEELDALLETADLLIEDELVADFEEAEKEIEQETEPETEQLAEESE
ncbi:MAG: 50S ribosomal protein L9 [Chloroflexota bacterium]|nr:50S ribosomal protein L9 [Chloroflexota bacterium]